MLSTNAIILKSLTNYKPDRISQTYQWSHVSDLNLADNELLKADPIDIIIGADLYGVIMLNGIRKGRSGERVAQNTVLGWILSGPVSPSAPSASIHTHHGAILTNLDQILRKFWEIEDLPESTSRSSKEQLCEEHFLLTHSRNHRGRYIVRLPFKPTLPKDLGDSRYTALASLRRLERRLNSEPEKASAYSAFLSEYRDLGHMEKIEIPENIPSPSSYYIPHHAIFREGSATSRLRVVFNASSNTSCGTSLNDYLMAGPKLQNDLAAIILKWRQFRYVLTADIAKMYRQILIDARDRDYQRILWRPASSDPIEEYRLLTVTYGTTSALFLALRVLQQLARDEGTNFPLALPVLQDQIYVDDCIFGADDKILARQTRDQLIALLKKGGFRLRKWASNSSHLLTDIDPIDHGLACSKELRPDESLKILGISWHPERDVFCFCMSRASTPGATKREILSTIARLFDPLGWVTPVIIKAKLLMQALWSVKCDWDEKIPQPMFDEWAQFHSRLSTLNNLVIPRWTTYGLDTINVELHGFSDASTKAYAAAIYLRVETFDSPPVVHLLVAKSKVAPIKAQSIPRLELCAALLLARLMRFTRSTLNFPSARTFCWTDSTIVLAWIRQTPSRWKTFVANRVAKIQELVDAPMWSHVSTKDNPADCASRGIYPDELINYRLWWSGPAWLKLDPASWPRLTPPFNHDFSLEQRTTVSANVVSLATTWDLQSRFSSWFKLLRVTALIMRFISKLHNKKSRSSANQKLNLPIVLDPSEIQRAKLFWLRTIQLNLFHQELKNLNQSVPVARSSPLSPLSPYLDKDGIIRVRGRLNHSELPDAAKNPIILKSHLLVTALIRDIHIRHLHAGSRLTLQLIRTEFWLLRARTTVRSVLYHCIKCTREKALTPEQLMGELPKYRVTAVARAFIHTGVDYAGPISLRLSAGRGHKSHKAYIAIFICMTVKAVHIELVSDYSANAFIAAYNRFVSRRGIPSAMYSDNGTTFQGADREITSSYRAAANHPDFRNRVAYEGVSWHFLPPAAPHFGGLWEAAVKSVKYHLKRAVGCHTLTFEEMTTLLCRIEACLNSRPIAAVSDNLDDYQALTPGHFLVGTALTSLPEPSVIDLNEHRLSRWQLVQRLHEIFWNAWKTDYLHTLQQRPKWRSAQVLARVGQLVLLRDANTPPSRWALGRITNCHPGKDALVRVVTVKTATAEYKRPITKICFLPVHINEAAEK